MSGFLQDDSGNFSSGRLILLIFAIVFAVCVILIVTFKLSEPTDKIFSTGFLTWTGEVMGVIITGKGINKHLENKKINEKTP